MRYISLQRTRLALAGSVLLGLAAALPAPPAYAGDQAVPREIQTPESCEAAMASLSADAAELRALRKLFKKHLHLRGTAHNPFPHWDADYSDMQTVFAALVPSNIPAIVYLLREGGMNGGMRSIGAGVLRMFGTQSLPCIEAALRKRGIKGYADLSGARIGIESDATPPLR
ncbi:hypothetical protein ACFPOU_23465 [Massilia jejuensis]|uniref:Uncharacterized protein n=1 Tax=Massilia jejuensis TaxID=648894 RepID=A0ABW0PRD1_9BURK